MLASVIRKYWHALVRDLLDLGFRASDLFTTLSFHEVLCIVLGAHPQTSVRFFLDQGWSREAHLLANLQESQQGMARLPEAYDRPGIEDRRPDPTAGKFFQADAMTWTEMDELERKRYSTTAPKGTNHARAI